MNEMLITDNACEELRVKWDEERFAIIHQFKGDTSKKVVILNPKEAIDLMEFIVKRV